MSGLTLPFAADVSMRSYALTHYRYWREPDQPGQSDDVR